MNFRFFYSGVVGASKASERAATEVTEAMATLLAPKTYSPPGAAGSNTEGSLAGASELQLVKFPKIHSLKVYNALNKAR